MAKTFEKRVSKRKRKVITLNRDLYRNYEENLLEGAKLKEIELKKIIVKDQVRTKFNESSIKELAANIEANGLIQPLVVHREKNKYTLICGERRFRAMSSIEVDSAPCFVLEDKSSDELMAIQFSENSSREALHYVDKADGILNYQKATKASERKICKALGISKTDVHRSLIIGKLPKRIREAAKLHDIEKYVLIEFNGIENKTLQKKIERQIIIGEVRKRAELRKILREGIASNVKGLKKASRKKVLPSRVKKKPSSKVSIPAGMTANAFVKAMKSQAKKLDPDTRKLLNSLLKETSEVVEIQ
jgi:ParB family transcriptional regulator, chromosome partitioning protein